MSTNNNIEPMTVVATHGQGNASQEYILLRANEDLNTRFVLVCDTTFEAPAHVSNKLRHSFWLPDLDLKKGDLFTMWTGKGTNKMTKLPDGRQMYHHYLQLGSAIWNDENDRALVMFLSRWKSFPVAGTNGLRRAA